MDNRHDEPFFMGTFQTIPPDTSSAILKKQTIYLTTQKNGSSRSVAEHSGHIAIFLCILPCLKKGCLDLEKFIKKLKTAIKWPETETY